MFFKISKNKNSTKKLFEVKMIKDAYNIYHFFENAKAFRFH